VKHPAWQEWEGVGLAHEDDRILYTPYHTDDTESLYDTLRLTGWVSPQAARAYAVGLQDLQVGWFGYLDGAIIPRACDQDGYSLTGDGQQVELMLPLTWIKIV